MCTLLKQTLYPTLWRPNQPIGSIFLSTIRQRYIFTLKIVFSEIYRLELHNAITIYGTSHFYRKSQIDCSDSIEH